MLRKQGKHVCKPPCEQCLYKRGLVETVINPCPQCQMNGYSAYEWFLKNALKAPDDPKDHL